MDQKILPTVSELIEKLDALIKVTTSRKQQSKLFEIKEKVIELEKLIRQSSSKKFTEDQKTFYLMLVRLIIELFQ